MSEPQVVADKVAVRVEFSGGLELLFGNQTHHRVVIPKLVDVEGSSRRANVKYLIQYLRENLLKERAELFVENETVQVATLY
jgi:ubiquitin related modifier 1